MISVVIGPGGRRFGAAETREVSEANGDCFVPVCFELGFDEVTAKERGRDYLRDPGEGLAMIGIDPVTIEDVIISHMHYTGSTRAKEILDNWDEYRPKFAKVMPVEYRRALREMEQKHQSRAAE